MIFGEALFGGGGEFFQTATGLSYSAEQFAEGSRSFVDRIYRLIGILSPDDEESATVKGWPLCDWWNEATESNHVQILPPCRQPCQACPPAYRRNSPANPPPGK